MLVDVLQGVPDTLICVALLSFFIHGAQFVRDSHINDRSAPFHAFPRSVVNDVARFFGIHCDSATFLLTHVSLGASRRHLHKLTIVE